MKKVRLVKKIESIFKIKYFSSRIKISYGITVCNEAEELDRLLKFLLSHKDPDDEVIVLSDKENTTQEVYKIIDLYKEEIKPVSYPLNGDFASFKNNLIQYSTGDYLFQIDADEIPNAYLISNLKLILCIYNKYDCFYVPRVNRVEGITKEHIEKWNWKIDEKNRINFPDMQMRLFRLNKGIQWENKVHEVLTGYSKKKRLPYKNENYCLYHIKNIEKQEKQNSFYETLE